MHLTVGDVPWLVLGVPGGGAAPEREPPCVRMEIRARISPAAMVTQTMYGKAPSLLGSGWDMAGPFSRIGPQCFNLRLDCPQVAVLDLHLGHHDHYTAGSGRLPVSMSVMDPLYAVLQHSGMA